MTTFAFKGKKYSFDSNDCYKNGSPHHLISLPDGGVLKVAWWDRDDLGIFDPVPETPPQPKRIFNMDMRIPEDAKLFPATEVTD